MHSTVSPVSLLFVCEPTAVFSPEEINRQHAARLPIMPYGIVFDA